MPITTGSRVLAAIECETIKAVVEYWQALGSSGGIALKSAFDPVALPPAAWPRLFMVEKPHGETAFRLRLMGTYVVGAIGTDFTGCRLLEAEIPGIMRSVTFNLVSRLFDANETQHYRGAPTFPLSLQYQLHEQVVLPLYGDASDIVAAVGAIDYAGFSGGILSFA